MWGVEREKRINPEGRTYVENQGCVLQFINTGDGGSYVVQNCPAGVNQMEVQSMYNQLETEDSRSRDDRLRASNAAAAAQAREEAGLCTLKADLSKAEVEVLLPDDDFNADDGAITNSDLDSHFGINDTTWNWNAKTEKDKRDIKDKFNLLCFYSSVKRIQTWLVFAAGFLTILFITIGGLLWTTSGTNPNRRKLAEKFIKSALIGFVIVLLALPVLRIVRAFFT